MIVTDVGGLAETIPHEEVGFVVPPERPSVLAESVVRFFDDNWQEQLADGVRDLKQRQHPDRLFEAIEALIASADD